MGSRHIRYGGYGGIAYHYIADTYIALYHRTYATRDEAKRDLFAYVESFYNRQRLRSALDYHTPDQAARVA